MHQFRVPNLRSTRRWLLQNSLAPVPVIEDVEKYTSVRSNDVLLDRKVGVK